jgi:tetratricopeptide (TPR) repeat protein
MKSDPASKPAPEHVPPITRWTSTFKGITAVAPFLRDAGRRITESFRALTSDFWTKSIGVLALILSAALCALLVALVLRFASPKSQITVSAFEIFVADQKSSSLSGKALADLIVDNLHRILDQADRFSGNAYSSREAYTPVPGMPHIPVDTSYGIEIKGISVDGILATWNHVRFQEFLISGDLLSGPNGGSVIRIRYASAGRANSFESHLGQIDSVAVQNAAAELALDILKEINPEVAARYLMARIYDCYSDCQDALENAVQFSRNWTNMDPDNGASFYYLGSALLNTKHPGDALPFLERALELDKSLDLALGAKGNILLGEGRYREAEAAYKAALQIRTSPNSLMSLGVVAARQGRYPDAEAYYRKALDEDSRYVGAYLALGNVLLRQSKSTEAVKAYRQAWYIQPDNSTALSSLVLSLVKDGKAAEALQECEQAARLKPDDDGPLVNQGIVYLWTKQTDQAVKLFQQNESPEAQIQLGIAYLEQGHLDSAREIFDAFVSTYPDNPRLHHLLAQVLEAQGNTSESKSHADESERLMPGFKYITLDDMIGTPRSP